MEKSFVQSPSGLSQLVVNSQIERLDSVLREECRHVDREQLSYWCGLPGDWLDGDSSLTQEDFYRLLRQLHEGDVPNIALRVASRTRLDNLGVMGYAMLACPTLRHGIELSQQLAERTYPYLQVTLETTDEHALLVCKVQPGGYEFFQLLQEIWVVSAWKYIQELLPSGVAPCASFAQFNYPTPIYHWQYQQLLGCRVQFGQSQTVLAIPRQWLSTPVQRGSLSAKSLYETQVVRLLRELGSRGDIVSRVKRLLLERSAECDYSLEKTAPLMSLSARSLRRYLADSGVSFRQICLEVRMNLAKDYLFNSQLTAQEIAYQLGYSQANNFYRAFKLFYGEPPERYRVQHADSDVLKPGRIE